MTAEPVPFNRDAFNRLLDFLDADRDVAGQKYERIQRKLVKFFEWRGFAAAEEMADATIDRVMRRLTEGEQIRASDPAVYFYGVARYVAHESWTAQARAPQPIDDEPIAVTADDDEEKRLHCLDRCLDQIPPKTREMILEYYRARGRQKIENRQRLAQALAISQSALRLRAQRVRDHLEKCVRHCLQMSTDDTSPVVRPLQSRERR